jgi:hypothetical protein
MGKRGKARVTASVLKSTIKWTKDSWTPRSSPAVTNQKENHKHQNNPVARYRLIGFHRKSTQISKKLYGYKARYKSLIILVTGEQAPVSQTWSSTSPIQAVEQRVLHLGIPKIGFPEKVGESPTRHDPLKVDNGAVCFWFARRLDEMQAV